MSDIYGKLTEHPEFPIDDSRRFTVEIRRHEFEQPPKRRAQGFFVLDPFCARCGFHRLTDVHFKEPDGAE